MPFFPSRGGKECDWGVEQIAIGAACLALEQVFFSSETRQSMPTQPQQPFNPSPPFSSVFTEAMTPTPAPCPLIRREVMCSKAGRWSWPGGGPPASLGMWAALAGRGQAYVPHRPLLSHGAPKVKIQKKIWITSNETIFFHPRKSFLPFTSILMPLNRTFMH